VSWLMPLIVWLTGTDAEPVTVSRHISPSASGHVFETSIG
jgi:hypothetical protein